MEMSEEEFYKTLEKSDGSFLIVKLEKERIWIATDWLGTRPLYYAVLDNGIVFSSCFWSIARFFKEGRYPIKINYKAIVSYLWLGRVGVLGDRTFIENVVLSPPGTILMFDLESNKLNFHRYHELKYETLIKEKTSHSINVLYISKVC